MNTRGRIIVGLCGVLPGLLVLVSQTHADETLVTKPSHYTVAETIDRIERLSPTRECVCSLASIMRTRRGRSGWKCLLRSY
jgi:hypothetical protein